MNNARQEKVLDDQIRLFVCVSPTHGGIVDASTCVSFASRVSRLLPPVTDWNCPFYSTV
jgi:hypothetical protein